MCASSGASVTCHTGPSDKNPRHQNAKPHSGATAGGFVSVRHGDNLQMRISSSLSHYLLNHGHDATPDRGWQRRPYVNQFSQLQIARVGRCNRWCAYWCASFTIPCFPRVFLQGPQVFEWVAFGASCVNHPTAELADVANVVVVRLGCDTRSVIAELRQKHLHLAGRDVSRCGVDSALTTSLTAASGSCNA